MQDIATNTHTVIKDSAGRIVLIIADTLSGVSLGETIPEGTLGWDKDSASVSRYSSGSWVTTLVQSAITGDLTGNVTGNITGNITGNVTGDLSGNVTGNVTGGLTLPASDVRINLSSATIDAANTDGGLIKGGTSSAKITENTPSMKFVSFYFDNNSTSGTSQGLYVRQYVSGAAGSGQAARFYATINNVAAATARGAHISLDFGTTGKATGLGAALETTLHVPSTGASWAGGNYTSLKVAVNSDAAGSDPAGATECSFLRFENQGDATGMADVDTDFFLFSLQGLADGAGLVFRSVGAKGLGNIWVGSLKIKVGATTYYIPLVNAEAA